MKTINAECDYNSVFDYGPDYQRNRMTVFENADLGGAEVYSKYYLNEYEITYYEGQFSKYKEVSYIETPSGIVAAVVYKKANTSNETFYYIHSDYLGSVEALSNADGTSIPEARFSYGAWGELRNPETWKGAIDDRNYFELLDRGFTGHEHLREYDLINMNGRVYDQVLGQFLQPDNNISFPESAQGYNRFAYVMNNPLKYTDPSGEHPGLILMLAFQVTIKATAITYQGGDWGDIANMAAMTAFSQMAGMAAGAIGDLAVEGISKSVGWFEFSWLPTEVSTSMVSAAIGNVAGSLLLKQTTGSNYTWGDLGGDIAGGMANGFGEYSDGQRSMARAQTQADKKLWREFLSSVDSEMQIPQAQLPGLRQRNFIANDLPIPQKKEQYLLFEATRITGKKGIEGDLDLYQTYEWGEDQLIESWEANSGSLGKRPIPNGTDYEVSGLRDNRGKSYANHGVGYTYNIAPEYMFQNSTIAVRSSLRIHPDGGYTGTAGCIGLTGNAKRLMGSSKN